MDPLSKRLDSQLRQLTSAGLFRDPASPLLERAATAARRIGTPLLNASSNDYLGLRAAPLRTTPAALGAGASRLIHGTSAEHLATERAFSSWLQYPAALLFTSGYAANVGVLSGLPDGDDRIVSDQFNHASIIDGCRLAPCRTEVVPHLDLAAIEDVLRQPHSGLTWVVVEAYYSMDGNSPDLRTLRRLCTEHGAVLLVDEAHSVGHFGPQGRGLCSAQGMQPDILLAPLGKAFGAQGALALGPRQLTAALWNRARSFIYSTAMSPALADLLGQRLLQVQAADLQRTALESASNQIKETLTALGGSLPVDHHGPILPLITGGIAETLAAAEHLADHGILVQAIRPPTVPEDACRLRLSARANLSSGEIARLCDALSTLAL